MADLSTQYMGLPLKNPIVPGASPLSRNLDTIRRLEDNGAPAIVLYSLFEEQIRHETFALNHYLSHGSESFVEAAQYFPPQAGLAFGSEEYLEHLHKAKLITDLPIIASLNGTTANGWIQYARNIEQAGADGLEINLYFIPADPFLTGYKIESLYLELLREVKSNIKIPVALKLSPFFSALANMAVELDKTGVDALVLFNRFYQPEIDIEALEVVPQLELSSSFEKRLPMRWIAILHGRIQADLASSSGVSTHRCALQMLMAGAQIVQVASVLLRHGPEWLARTLRELNDWLDEYEYDSVEELIGTMSHLNCPDPAAFERANYMKVLQSYQ